jgi:hypothetical protein
LALGYFLWELSIAYVLKFKVNILKTTKFRALLLSPSSGKEEGEQRDGYTVRPVI